MEPVQQFELAPHFDYPLALLDDFGLRLVFVILEFVAAAPQVYPHIGTTVPSGNVAVVGAAVKLTVPWPIDGLAPTRRTSAAKIAVFRALR